MNGGKNHDTDFARLAELRRVFDEQFALPAVADSHVGTYVVLAVAGGERVALDTSEVSGFVRARHITPVPSEQSALLGVAGVRAAMLPVFSLGRLIGANAEREVAAWLALCGTPPLLALALDEISGFVPLPQEEAPAQGSAPVAEFVSRMVYLAGHVHALLDLPLLLQSITAVRE